MISSRHLFFIITTFVLVAALVFLYNKTEAVDVGERNEIVALLRELQEIEGRWDIDMLRMRTEMDPGQLAAPNRTTAAQNALRALANAAPHANSPALSANMGAITGAITEKAGLIEKYKAANSRSKDALRAMMSMVKGADVTQIHIRDARHKEFARALDSVAFAASEYYWQEQDAQRKTLEAALAGMQELAGAMDAVARGQAGAMNDAAQSLIKAKFVEHELSARTALLTSGSRLNGLVLSFNRELETTLGEKERFRVYMIAYAAALLIGIGYLGIRIVAANEMLERRVADRTRELSDALNHLKESEAQLIQSEKMSSLGHMVAGIAHEINTPLAYVNNSLAAVNDRLPGIMDAISQCEKLLALLNDPDVRPDELNRQFARVAALLDRIKQHEPLTELAVLVKDGIYGTGQVAEIVSNLKDFSRLDRSKVSSFNLVDGLNSTLGLARHMLKTVRVNRNFGAIPAITCSPSQINQVFLNLITNAAQALPEHNGEITLTTRTEGGGVTVEVEDNGSGITPEVLPKIFDPFFTTKEIGTGTGLGLSISYQIIKDHGGSINVESKVGSGTKFIVWLPFKPPSETQLSV